ncbi:MAG: phosphatase PAP2 family protein [Mycobacteriales bacterium]
MPHWDPGWRFALCCATLCLALALLLRRRPRLGAGLREVSVAMGLWAVWVLIGSVTHPHVQGAEARGRWLFRAEHRLRLPSEVTLVRHVADHPWLAHVVDSYYVYGHLNVIVVLLAWTWWRHRPAYPALRAELVLLSLAGLALQLLTVAPPRLLPDLGFVDVANSYGESVYGQYADGLSGQLMAMPSLHVGWAALVAWTVWRQAPPRWRWLGPAHLALMTIVVVASANHWWLDAIVAVLLLCLVVVAVERFPRRVPLRVPVAVASA